MILACFVEIGHTHGSGCGVLLAARLLTPRCAGATGLRVCAKNGLYRRRPVRAARLLLLLGEPDAAPAGLVGLRRVWRLFQRFPRSDRLEGRDRGAPRRCPVAADPRAIVHHAPAAYSADGADGPWVVTIDDFLSEEEAKGVLSAGSRAGTGWQRSLAGDGVQTARTSSTSWCRGKCLEDATMKAVQARVEALTGVPRKQVSVSAEPATILVTASFVVADADEEAVADSLTGNTPEALEAALGVALVVGSQ